MLPQAGGWMTYAERAFGRYIGYVVAWADWVSSCVTGALVALLSADFAAQLLPSLTGHTSAVALALVAGFGAVQWRGVRAGSQTQEWTSLLMAVGLVAVVVGCFWQLPAATQPVATAPLPLSLAALMVISQAVVFAYDGWYAAIYFAEEDHNPTQDLPRALLLGVGLILLTYLLLNAALLHALPLAQVAAAPLPLAAAAARFAGPWGERLVLVVALLALGGVLNSVLLMATRVLFALSRDGLMPARLARVASGGTPRLALAVALLVTAALVLTGTAEKLLAITTILYVGYYAVGYAAVLQLRRREPQLLRPFRAWGYPLSTLVVLAGSVAFLLGNVLADPRSSLTAAALLALSYPVYRWIRRTKAAVKPEPVQPGRPPE
jgi:APA family basic amino acid/polyamine antiporter